MQESVKPKLLVLLGPTAVGKTKLSLELAETFRCEIISGDSMQVYRSMDIGTAKATPEERRRVPHHMVDICDPEYPFSVAEFQELAKRSIDEIRERGRLPFLVGGTGLYIESVCYNYEFGVGGEDAAFREEQKEYARIHGAEALHRRLAEIDPATAQRLHPNDQRRVIRALEFVHVTGKLLSEQLNGQKRQSPYELCIIGLTMQRELLYKRIEARIDDMLKDGLVQEVRGLLERGCPPDSVSMQGLGYKEIVSYLRGELDLPEAMELLKRNTRRFAKRQLSWFRHMKEIHWIDVSDPAKFSLHNDEINGIITEKFAPIR